jgi:hypothetical protein
LRELVRCQGEGERLAPHSELTEVRHVGTMSRDGRSRLIIPSRHSSHRRNRVIRTVGVACGEKLTLQGSGYERGLFLFRVNQKFFAADMRQSPATRSRADAC